MRIVLDAMRLQSKDEAHKYLRDALNFPEYYGGNLDALHDCLTEFDDIEIEFMNTDRVSGGYFARVMNVFKDSAEENPELKILP